MAARWLWPIAVGLLALATVLTALLERPFLSRMLERPFLSRMLERPWLCPLPLVAVASAGFARRAPSQGKELRAFGASCTFIVSMLVATAVALYPTLLRSTIDDAFTLDTTNAASESAGRTSGMVIWTAAIVLAIGYFVYIFRSFRGKTEEMGHYD